MKLKRFLLFAFAMFMPLSMSSFNLASNSEPIQSKLIASSKAKEDSFEGIENSSSSKVILESIHTKERDALVDAVYSDEIFFRPSTQYSHFLARQSFGLASASTNLYDEDNAVEKYNGKGTLLDYLSQHGFSEIREDDYHKETSLYTVGTAMAHKVIEKDGEKADLFVVAIRGARYKNEWTSNLSMNAGFRHEGFDSAATLVTDRTISFIGRTPVQYPIKIWITGFSRAGAIANLTAANLNDSRIFTKEQIYAYTFATPRVVWGVDYDDNIHESVAKEDLAKGYENIFNILGASDMIPQFAPHEWAYLHYGIDRYLPGREFNSDFVKKYQVIQEGIAKMGGTVNYSVELNLRVRLLYGLLQELVESEYEFMSILQWVFVSILTDKNINNIAQTLREAFSLWAVNYPQILPKKDRLLDYLMGLFPPLVFGNGFIKGETSSVSNPLEYLLHEHSPEFYYYWLYNFTEKELFGGADFFSYVTFDGNPTLILTEKKSGEEILRIKNKRKVDSSYAKENGIDLYFSLANKKPLLALPFDKDYELSYEINEGESFNLTLVPYSRYFHSHLTQWDAKINKEDSRSGSVFAIEDGVGELVGGSKEIRTSDFAAHLGADKGVLSFFAVVFLLVFVPFLIVAIFAWLLVFIRSKLTKIRPSWIRFAFGMMAFLFAAIAEGFYWFAADRIYITMIFKIFAMLAVFALYLYKRKLSELKTPQKTIAPFLALASLGYILLSANVLAGEILFIFAAIYLCYHFYRLHRIPGDHWVSWAFLSTAAVAFIFFSGRSQWMAMIPMAILAFPMVFALICGLKVGGKKMVAAWVIFGAYVMLGANTFMSIPLFSSLLFILLFNLAMILFAISEIDGKQMMIKPNPIKPNAKKVEA